MPTISPEQPPSQSPRPRETTHERMTLVQAEKALRHIRYGGGWDTDEEEARLSESARLQNLVTALAQAEFGNHYQNKVVFFSIGKFEAIRDVDENTFYIRDRSMGFRQDRMLTADKAVEAVLDKME